MIIMQLTAWFIIFVSLTSSDEVHANYYFYDYGESVTCNKTESIIGGTVIYPSDIIVGSEVTFECDAGFQPFPISKKVCNSQGQWEPKISRVICEEGEDYGDYDEEPQKNCSVSETIKHGTVSYSNQGLEGSVLKYHCGTGRYPYPMESRVCNSNGEWSRMVLPNAKTTSVATCKDVLCPAQLQLDNGEFSPRKQWFKVGETQTFFCKGGYTLSGSALRNCTKWGLWTGSIPVCYDQSDDCGNPEIPPGALRSGNRFRIGDQVQYRCQSGLELLGPEVRVCLNSKEWSGPVPRCQAHYTYDLPATVAQAIQSSLSAVMEVSSPEFKKKAPTFGRSMKMKDSRLNIFILIDASGSISHDHFENAKNATADLIRKLSSYDVEMKFDIISYASEPHEIVTILNPGSNNVEFVLKKLKEFNQTSHGKKIGTNLYKALYSVYERLQFLGATKNNHLNETQNVILIETDGFSNMGGNLQHVLGLIRQALGYKDTSLDHTEEELLDVYVFGIGQNVKRKELKELASKKIKEQHLFVLSSYTDLGIVFNTMINDSAVTKCGVAHELVFPKNDDNPDKPQPVSTRPWHVTVYWKLRPCQGSILTENWILTAAHCFIKVSDGEENAVPRDVVIIKQDSRKETRVASVLKIHPNFNVKGLRDKNVQEFYDYDVALIKLNSSIKFSTKARPICLPCTKASNRALKLNSDATCKHHKTALLESEETGAFFIRQGKDRMKTHIQSGERRTDCIEQYKAVSSENHLVSLTDVITDRFLCTGGSMKHKDDITCKGDSGGSLFLRKRMRYFQVGVVSWGTKFVCDTTTKSIPSPPDHARDFHINVFSVMPWLKENLEEELEFLP